MMRKSVCVACLSAIAALAATTADLRADQLWSVHGGHSTLSLDLSVLSHYGLRVESTDPANYPAPDGQVSLPVSFEDEQFVLATRETSRPHFTSGTVHHRAGLVIAGPGGQVIIDDLAISAEPGVSLGGVRDGELHTTSNASSFSSETSTLVLRSDAVVISRALAAELGVPAATGRSIGTLQSDVDMAYVGGDPLPTGGDDAPVPHVCSNPTVGPDVIVGDMQGISNYAIVGGIDAFSVGTISCNIGNVNLQWQSENPNHPVIPQNMYRMKTVNGSVRFEQIGMSWMKHGFTALTQNLCCPCNGQGGSVLGQGCSDPYTSGRNGTQVTTVGGCGPRFQTNPHTGAFTFPYMFRGVGTMGGGSDPNTISRRLQVPIADLDPTLNPGAAFFVETQYVSPDDAAAKNQNNNASYRPCTITTEAIPANGMRATVSAATVRQKAAIQAWKAADPTVTETLIDTPEDKSVVNFPGRGILAAKATSLGNGVWHYEYALYNMNSDRGFSSYSVPVNPGQTVTNIGFRDVNYHSGDGFGTAVGALVTIDGTDWPGLFSGGNVSWACVPLAPPANINNTNYLRWGTMYNFRFDCNAPPATGDITIGMFKAVAGEPNSITVNTVIPQPSCDAPVIDPIAAQNAICGSPFTSSTPATSGTGPFTWTITAGAQPGMTVNASGVVSWPNPVASASAYVITLQAASTCSAATDTEDMSITVPFATDPQIDAIAPQNATCGSPFTSAAPTGTGLAGAAWSIILGGQPGMTIDASGVVSWPNPVPSASPYDVTIQATNNCAPVSSDSEVMSISVPFAADPVIDPLPVQNGACGVGFSSSTPTGSGLVGATWSIASGGQPGMAITSAGVIGWPLPVPSATPYDVTIQASQPCSANAATTVVSISIPFGPTPTINPIAPTSTVCGWEYGSMFPIAGGGSPPYTWSLVGAPAGMTVDASTGQILWNNPVVSPAPYNVTLQVTDACAGGFGTTPFVLTVRIGDFDGDGVISILDVPIFIDHLMGTDTSTTCAGDINGDTFLDGLDVQAFLSLL